MSGPDTDSDADVDVDVDLLVVGGGPCGLAAAVEAARRGFSVQLVESAPTLGGMAASFTVAGQRVDLGSHRLHPSMSPRVRTLLTELLGDDLQVRVRRGRLRLRGRWVAFPLRALDLARSLPPSFIAASARDVVTVPLRRSCRSYRGPADSYAEVVRAGLGPTALAGFHGPMAQKLWGVPADELSGELARKRLSVRTPAELARTIARATRPDGRTFLYPRRGYGQIVEALADAADDLARVLGEHTRPTAGRQVLLRVAGRSARADRNAGLSAEVIRGQVRSIVVDLLVLAGVDEDEAISLVPETYLP
jgi:protoporphyrinogen oxidase